MALAKVLAILRQCGDGPRVRPIAVSYLLLGRWRRRAHGSKLHADSIWQLSKHPLSIQAWGPEPRTTRPLQRRRRPNQFDRSAQRNTNTAWLISLRCPRKVCTHTPVLAHHTFAVWSADAVSTNDPSGEKVEHQITFR